MRLVVVCWILLASLMYSCSGDVNITNETDQIDSLTTVSKVGEAKIIEPIVDDEVATFNKNGITLTEIKTKFDPNATIELNNKTFDIGLNQLSFNVESNQQNNIAYLANNYSLSTYTSNIFEIEYLVGNNVFLAFLTDQNGISIKTNKGCVLKNVVLGGVESLFDMNQPHLFYYLPQSESKEAILDFYLVNTSISKASNRVKVTIDGIEFIIDKWAAYSISGIKNESTIRIQLIDKNGNLIEGPFNDSGDRIVKVKEFS